MVLDAGHSHVAFAYTKNSDLHFVDEVLTRPEWSARRKGIRWHVGFRCHATRVTQAVGRTERIDDEIPRRLSVRRHGQKNEPDSSDHNGKPHRRQHAAADQTPRVHAASGPTGGHLDAGNLANSKKVFTGRKRVGRACRS